MRRKFAAAVLICGLIALSACVKEADDRAIGIYHRSREESELFKIADVVPPDEENAVEFAFSELLAENDRYYSPLPEGTRMLSYELQNGELTLRLSDDYGKADAIGRVIADYSLTLTLCALSGVEALTLFSGELCVARGLTPDDVVLSAGGASNSRIRLYYPDSGGRYLKAVYVEIGEDEPFLERRVMELLREAPKDSGLRPALPENVELLTVSTDESGICSIHLSAGFYENKPESAEEERVIIYSIVNSLCSLSKVKAVQFLADGKAPDYFLYIALDKPLTMDGSLVGLPPQAEVEPDEDIIYEEAGLIQE